MRVPLEEIGPDGLLTVGQTALLLQVASPTVGYWIKRGGLRVAEQTGAGPMFRRREVEVFAKQRAAEKAAKAAKAKRAAKASTQLPLPTKRSAVG